MGRGGHLETIVILDTPRCSNMIPFDFCCRCKHVDEYSLNWDLWFLFLERGSHPFIIMARIGQFWPHWLQWGDLLIWKLFLFLKSKYVPMWSLLTYVVDVSICNNIHLSGSFCFSCGSEEYHTFIIMARIGQFWAIGYNGENWSFGNYCYSRFSKMFQYDPFWLLL